MAQRVRSAAASRVPAAVTRSRRSGPRVRERKYARRAAASRHSASARHAGPGWGRSNWTTAVSALVVMASCLPPAPLPRAEGLDVPSTLARLARAASAPVVPAISAKRAALNMVLGAAAGSPVHCHAADASLVAPQSRSFKGMCQRVRLSPRRRAWMTLVMLARLEVGRLEIPPLLRTGALDCGLGVSPGQYEPPGRTVAPPGAEAPS